MILQLTDTQSHTEPQPQLQSQLQSQSQPQQSHPPQEKKSKTVFLIEDKYLVDSKQLIGSGSFGKVYVGINLENKQWIVVKVNEKTKGKTKEREIFAYKKLKEYNISNVPQCYFYNERLLILDMMGYDISTLLRNYNLNCLSLKTTLLIGLDMIKTLQKIHDSCGLIHRDIKPDNILISLIPDDFEFYLVDFGLTKSFRKIKKTKTSHIKFRQTEGNFIGTMKYGSLHSHEGMELSRRDDMISLGYTLIKILTGHLPWKYVKDEPEPEPDPDPHHKKQNLYYLKVKKETSLQDLCKDTPIEMLKYMEHVYSLKFSERPNYKYLYDLFKTLFKEKGYKKDGNYEWKNAYLSLH